MVFEQERYILQMYNLLYMKRNSFSCSDNKNTADQVISKLTQAALLWLPTFAIPVSCHLPHLRRRQRARLHYRSLIQNAWETCLWNNTAIFCCFPLKGPVTGTPARVLPSVWNMSHWTCSEKDLGRGTAAQGPREEPCHLSFSPHISSAMI